MQYTISVGESNDEFLCVALCTNCSNLVTDFRLGNFTTIVLLCWNSGFALCF